MKVEPPQALIDRLIAAGQVIPAGDTPKERWEREGLEHYWLPLPPVVVWRFFWFLHNWMRDDESWIEAANRLIALASEGREGSE